VAQFGVEIDRQMREKIDVGIGLIRQRLAFTINSIAKIRRRFKSMFAKSQTELRVSSEL
jgi:hypothetical protein